MATPVYHLLLRDPETGQRNITVFVGAEVHTASSESHPNFEEIVQAAVASDVDPDELVALFDVSEVVASRFDPLSERVTVANGRVYFDGDEVDNALTRQIVRFLEEDVEDWIPLVNFFENVAANPTEHSREQLYEWLDRHTFTIDGDGYLIAYKGVRKLSDGRFESVRSGYGIVDGEVIQNGYIPNDVGSIIEIPRSMVHHDPAVGCSVGMHVGTYEYASGWARGGLLKVRVNPRDVVSVPTDCNAQKVRVCRYEVLETIDHKIESAYDYSSLPEDDEDEDYCDSCGGPCDYYC